MKIVFIINSISAQRCIKRVEEFINHGYDVDVYGFNRHMKTHLQPKHFSLEIIGEFCNTLPFQSRVHILLNGINKVLNRYKNNSDVYFYLFQLDVALIFRLLSHGKKYFYEESDLMHTYIKNSFIKKSLEFVDKLIIRKSILSIFTSEGFLIYHYGNKWPENVSIITNRLNVDIENIEKINKRDFEENKLKVGFVGFPRYKSILKFIDIFCSNFPNYEFHVYGEIIDKNKDYFEHLQKYQNCFFHGTFSNPKDLPRIYSNIDIVLSTYDVEYENVRYAEPNKIYEAIYFETPIIVSSGTFLEKKVQRLGIGYSVDTRNDLDVISLIRNLNSTSIERARNACRKIKKSDCLNINTSFFKKIESYFALNNSKTKF